MSFAESGTDSFVVTAADTEMDKEKITHIIGLWIKNDGEMNQLKRELARRRETQKKLTGSLVSFMRENEMDDADIKYVQEMKKKTISKKGLLPILQRFFKGDAVKAAELSEYIYNNRETVIQETVKPVAIAKAATNPLTNAAK